MSRKTNRDFLRTLVFADMHCGHQVGLTPPAWWYVWETQSERQKKINQTQRELWRWFARAIDELKPIDRLMVLGDLVDGTGSRSGGTEQRTTDRAEQAEMAAFCINYIESPKVLITYGTPYHTGMDEDWENEIVARLKADTVLIGSQQWPRINNLQFDVKHFISGSSIPHGKWTPLARSKLWNQVWHSEHKLQPQADVLLRAHVHYHIYCGGPSWLAMTCPMMMGFGSKFGVRQIDRDAQIGLIVFDIDSEGKYKWKPIQARLPHMKARIIDF